MNAKLLSQNIRRIRTAGSMSQKALAEASGVSLPSIKKIEGGKGNPRVSTLQSIAGALGVKFQDLFVPVRELKAVRFRSSKKMQFRESILADVSRRLSDFNELENMLGEKKPFILESLRGSVSENDPEGSAGLCRVKLGLKEDEPIHDICGLLEHAGVKVFPLSVSSEGFFGLSVGEEDGGPAVIVNVYDRIPVERRIFSAAHELGHLVMHLNAYDSGQTMEVLKEEDQANLFASHFLMPQQGFLKEWRDAAGLHLVDRVFKVKRIFRVSYKSIIFRLVDSGSADKDIWKKFNWAYSQRYNRKLPYKEEPLGLKTEPARMQDVDFYEDRLSRLVRKAIEEDRISLSRGAEILRMDIEGMMELSRDWEALPG